MICALHCELPVSALAAIGRCRLFVRPIAEKPVVRDIPSGSVATSLLEIEVPSRNLLFICALHCELPVICALHYELPVSALAAIRA